MEENSELSTPETVVQKVSMPEVRQPTWVVGCIVTAQCSDSCGSIGSCRGKATITVAQHLQLGIRL